MCIKMGWCGSQLGCKSGTRPGCMGGKRGWLRPQLGDNAHTCSEQHCNIDVILPTTVSYMPCYKHSQQDCGMFNLQALEWLVALA